MATTAAEQCAGGHGALSVNAEDLAEVQRFKRDGQVLKGSRHGLSLVSTFGSLASVAFTLLRFT